MRLLWLDPLFKKRYSVIYCLAEGKYYAENDCGRSCGTGERF
jgi:hypothetical protein